MEKLRGPLQNGKNHESLAQRIFPRLRYSTEQFTNRMLAVLSSTLYGHKVLIF